MPVRLVRSDSYQEICPDDVAVVSECPVRSPEMYCKRWLVAVQTPEPTLLERSASGVVRSCVGYSRCQCKVGQPEIVLRTWLWVRAPVPNTLHGLRLLLPRLTMDDGILCRCCCTKAGQHSSSYGLVRLDVSSCCNLLWPLRPTEVATEIVSALLGKKLRQSCELCELNS